MQHCDRLPSLLSLSEYTDGSHASPPLTTLVVSLAQLDMLSLLDVVSAHDVMVTITDGDTNVLHEVRWLMCAVRYDGMMCVVCHVMSC